MITEPRPRLGPGEPIPISLVAHWVFCPRRAWLEAVGEHTDTAQVAAGVDAHASVDDPATGRPVERRAVEVADAGLGISGRCDAIEIGKGGALTIVEHKSTPVRRTPTVTEPMRVQLALQVRALHSAGSKVAGQAVYFVNHRVRVDVSLSEADFAAAADAVASTREVVESLIAPEPLEDDPRCASCSHVSVCLPDERSEVEVRRRILVDDPGTQVVHLATPGARASVRDGRMRVGVHGEEVASIPLEKVAGVVVHGNVDLTGGLIRELLWRSLPVVWTTGTGRVVGWAVAGAGPNGAARVRQHEAAAAGRLDLAREFVAAKISNQATQLRRNGDAAAVVRDLRALQARAGTARSLDELLGLEGDAAARYFGSWGTMLTPRARSLGFEFRTRSQRPARDEVNSLLNYAYAMLLGDAVRAVVACGLDPHAGFLHSATRNKPALALDLCEEFRAPLADSVVLGAINNGEINPSDFSAALGSVRMHDRARRALITAYERRVESEFRHPVFGYRVSWRRAMEIQARMVLGVLDGSQSRYVGIRIR